VNARLDPSEGGEDRDHRRRLELVPPAKVVQALRPKAGQRFLNVGCGAGSFFFPVFEAMGGQGVFLAAEWDEEMLRRFLNRLETYAEHPGYTRIEVVRAKPDRLPLPDRCADLILLTQVYHLVQDRQAYLRELRRLLSPGGQLCLLDWRPPSEDAAVGEETPRQGPDFAARVGEHEACQDLAAAGFPWTVAHTGFAQNWCLTARI
jgi:ubiquinone/menaquinone biosynthesis C-methylase UbiE